MISVFVTSGLMTQCLCDTSFSSDVFSKPLRLSGTGVTVHAHQRTVVTCDRREKKHDITQCFTKHYDLRITTSDYLPL